ncbi:MAG: tetratricopeptide repeat protein [Planctomycetaceae bacterium]|nr:tetratricopeptide repeat protein [Planctomycetaceae bacterium]
MTCLLTVSSPADEISREQKLADRYLLLLKRSPREGTALDKVFEYHRSAGSLDALVDALRREGETGMDGGAHFVRGLIELRRGKIDQAENALQSAATQRKDDGVLLMYRARIASAQQNRTTAIDHYEDALQAGLPAALEESVFPALGRLYQQTGQPAKAAEVWRRFEAAFPNDLQVLQQIAEELKEGGFSEEALQRYEKLMAASRDPEQRMQFLLAAADLKRSLQRSQEAKAELATALESIKPSSWLYGEIQQRIETIYLDTGDTAGLIAWYDSRLQQNPDDIATIVRLARLLDSEGRPSEAIARLTAAIPKAPADDRLGNQLITLLEQNNQIDAAIAQCERLHGQLISVGGATSDLTERWGRLCLRTDKPLPQRQADALLVWQTMADGSDDTTAILRVANLLSDAGMTEAETYYRRAVRASADSLLARESLGGWLHSAGRIAEAVEVWEQIAAPDLATAQRLRQLGEIYANYGLKDQHRETLERLQQLSPRFQDVLILAELLTESGDFSGAMVMLQQADELATSDAERRSVLDRQVVNARESGQLSVRISALQRQPPAKTSAHSQILLALLLAEAGREGEALTAIQTAVARQTDSLLCQSVAAELQETSGRWTQAISSRMALARLDRREASEHLRKVVELHRRLGQFERAVSAGETLLEAAPANVANYQFVADMCLDLGQVERAGEILNRCVQANPSSVAALQALGEHLGQRFRTAEAIDAYWSALEQTTDPQRRQTILTSLADLATRSGRFPELVSRLRRWSSRLSASEAARNMAIALRAGGSLGAAKKLLLAEHRRSPRDVETLKALVQLAEQEEDFTAAVTFQQQLFSVSRSQEAENRLGSLIVRAAESSRDLETWVRESRVDLPATVVVQQVDRLLQENRLAESRAFCERLLESSPDNWEALYRIAVIAARQQRTDECRQVCQQLMSLTIPDSTPAGSSSGTAPPSSLDLLSAMADRSASAVQRRINWLLQLARSDGWPEAADGRIPEFRNFAACRLHTSLLWWQTCQTQSERTELLQLLRPQSDTGMLNWSWWLLTYRSNRAQPSATHVESFVTATEKLLQVDYPETHAAFLATVWLRNRLPQEPPALPNDVFQSLQRSIRVVADVMPVNTLQAARIQQEIRRYDNTVQSEFIRVLSADDASVQTRELALQLAASDDRTFIAQLHALSSAWQQQGIAPTEGSILRRLGSVLYPRVLRDVRNDNPDSAAGYVVAYLQLRSRLPDLVDNTSATASDSVEVFERRNIVIKSQPGLFQQRRLVRAGGILTSDDHAFLVNLLEIFPEAQGSGLPQLVAEQISQSDNPGRVVLELMAAELGSLQGDVETAIVHVIRAAAVGENNVRLRVCLAAWYGDQGNQADALALLDTIDKDQPVLLQERETMALDFAAATGRTDRVKTAAERLFGLRLSGRQADDLSRRMRALGLTAEADALRDRQRSGQRDTLRDKVRLMGSESQEVAVEIAIELLRQTDSDVVSWTSDISSDKARQAAVDVLGAAGRLGDMIRTAELRLQESPDSVRLNEELLSFYEASGLTQKADAVRERLHVLSPETVDSMMQAAADFERRKENQSAADRYLAVFERDPLRFAQDYFRYLRLFADADRLPQIADLMLQPTTLKRLQNHHHVVMETVQFLFAASTRSDENRTREKGLLLFRAAWQQFPNYRRSIVSNIHTDAMWELPELVEYARDGLIPQSMQQAIARPWQGLAEKLDHAEDGSVRGTLSRIRTSLQQDRKLAARYTQRVERALQEYPNWHGGRVLLAVLLLDQERAEQSGALLEQIAADKEALFMPVHVAWLLSQEILRSDARHLDAPSIDLLQRVLKAEPPFPTGVANSASLWLARRFHQRAEHSRAVAVITESLRRLRITAPLQRATIVLDAAEELRRLGYQFHALRTAQQITAALFADPTDKPARKLLDRAAAMRRTADDLSSRAAALYLQMSASRQKEDLFLEAPQSGRHSGRLRSLVLDTLLGDRSRRIPTTDLTQWVAKDDVPVHMATAAVVIGHGRRNSTLLQAGAAAFERLTETRQSLPPVAWLAVQALQDQPEYANLASVIQDTVLQTPADGRPWIHAAMLTQAAKRSAAAGDQNASKDAWNEALDLLLAEDQGTTAGTDSDSSPGALQELRSLLLPAGDR